MIAAWRRDQAGVVLAVVLVWLMVATLLAISTTQIGLQDRKAWQNLRDREIAFQSAEAGLRDAEHDVSKHLAASRLDTADTTAQMRDLLSGFPRRDQALCYAGSVNLAQGLCRAEVDAELPAWLAIDLADSAAPEPVTYGRFTGNRMQTAAGMLPARLPRYLIERLRVTDPPPVPDPVAPSTGSVLATSAFYRITAIGFGARSTNQVVLQSYLRIAVRPDRALIPSTGAPLARDAFRPERRGWREISNWQELRQRARDTGEST